MILEATFNPILFLTFFYLIIDRDIRLNTYLRRKVIET